jgi:hypothetical protein
MNTREKFEQWWVRLALGRNTPDWYSHEGKAAAMAAWQARPEFTALCHSKSRQIGKPVGYLVENEAGGLAVVHNLGRVTWLDDCVAGPVEKAASAQDGGEPIGAVNKAGIGVYEFFPSSALTLMPDGIHKLYVHPPSAKSYIESEAQVSGLYLDKRDEIRAMKFVEAHGGSLPLLRNYIEEHPTSAVVPEWFNPHSTPPAHYQPVVGYHPEWIDSSNHAGVRECFTTGYGDVWLNSAWLEGADSYQTGKMVPLLWTHMPTPSKQEVIGDE